MLKSILITGSTDGIGKLTALKLAQKGHTIYLHGRNPQKLETLVEEMKLSTQNKNISGFIADFSDLNQVQNMAKKIIERVPNLDTLINNAGILSITNPHTQNGLDKRFVVNYLSAVLLTESLIPLISSSTDGRIINLSSAAQSPVSTDALNGRKALSDFEAYAQSKLALTMWSFHLANQHPEIITIPVNPGSMLNTNMVKDAFGDSGKSADKGAQILYDLVSNHGLNKVNGQYFDNDRGDFGRAHSAAYQKASIDELLEATETLLDKL